MTRLPGLDLLRAIAIVAVMFFHTFLIGGMGDEWKWLSRFGWMGVDLFFVLSGFLIGGQLLQRLHDGKPLGFAQFYFRRAMRVFPAFWVVLLVYLFFPAIREAEGMNAAWKFWTFTMNLGNDYSRSAFSHAWSLCVEEHFYLVFPFIAWWCSRGKSYGKTLTIAATILVAGIALRSGIWLHDTRMAELGAPERNWFVEDIYYPTYNRLDGLLVGVLLAVLKVFRPLVWQKQQRRANAWLLAGIVTVGFSMWLFRDRVGLLGNSVGWPVLSMGLGMLVLAASSKHTWIGRHALPGAGWIAAISYSVYLTHKAAMKLIATHWGDWLHGHGILTFAVYAICILAVGAALHYAVERPFLHLRDVKRRKSLPRRLPATD